MLHDLKIDPVPFDAIVSGRKRAEIRLNDRRYQSGDGLCLKEIDDLSGEYTGRYKLARITHVQCGYGLGENYVALSIELV